MERLSVLLVFLASLALAATEFPTKEYVEKLQPIVKLCKEKTGVDKDLVDKFSKGESMADDPNLKCYMKCMFLETNTLNPATGVFIYDRMLTSLPEEMRPIAYEMGNNCIHFKGEHDSDLCQLAYDLHKCWQKADPEHYFLL